MFSFYGVGNEFIKIRTGCVNTFKFNHKINTQQFIPQHRLIKILQFKHCFNLNIFIYYAFDSDEINRYFTSIQSANGELNYRSNVLC